MADDTPQLANNGGKKLAWYQGLSRYQWWVLIIASMGWMFDTMDQQFFNLGRGKAMMEMLRVDPVLPGLEKMGENTQKEYTPTDLDALVAAGTITADQKARALTNSQGKARETASRKDLAKVLGEDMPVIIDRYVQLAEDHKTADGKRLSDYKNEAFDRAALDLLIQDKVISEENAMAYLAEFESGIVPRQELARRMGREIGLSVASSAGNDSTTIFILGWAVGGLFFGWIGDSFGRAKTMALTILTYAIFTGLNGLARTEMEFNVLRFMTALGVGGEFAAGAALVAESMPERSRAAALGTLQALSAVGNMMGAAIAYFVLPISWRWLFFVGAIPGFVAVFVFLKLKEPQMWLDARKKWLKEKAEGITTKRSSYMGLLGDSRWRGRAIVGLLLGVVGVGGLWGVAFFKPELDRLIMSAFSEETQEKLTSLSFLLQQFGAFLGISVYTIISLKVGRRPAFAIFFALAFLVVSYTFMFANTTAEAFILAPLVGFVTLGPFGGYSIYFAELFPTRLRATGVGFCYNVGRFLAAPVSWFKARLADLFMAGTIGLPYFMSAQNDANLAMRYASFLMVFIYLFGLIILLFAPETKDQPLPEEDDEPTAAMA